MHVVERLRHYYSFENADPVVKAPQSRRGAEVRHRGARTRPRVGSRVSALSRARRGRSRSCVLDSDDDVSEDESIITQTHHTRVSHTTHAHRLDTVQIY